MAYRFGQPEAHSHISVLEAGAGLVHDDPPRSSGVRNRRDQPEASRMTQPSAQPLLSRIAAGDGAAVKECLDRYGALVWSVVRKAWVDVATVEDLVQEIFIEVWSSAERFDPERASEATFIATIARRRVIDRRRRVGRRPDFESVEDVEVGIEDDALSSVDVGDDARQARAALDELRPEQRKVILMSVVEGLTHPEIASATGLPLGTVKSHIRRGLEHTAKRLRSMRGEEQ